MLQWRLTTKNVTIHRVTLWLITIRLGASSGEGGLTGTITMQDQSQALVLLFSLRVLIAILDTVGKITVSRTVSWMESSFVYYSLWWPFPFNISDKICAYLWLLKFRSWGVDVYNVTKLDQHPTLHFMTFIPSSLDISMLSRSPPWRSWTKTNYSLRLEWIEFLPLHSPPLWVIFSVKKLYLIFSSP